ncbi:MAG: hypothetical protein ABL961_01745, partial [Vicinamibacterales bacterium]
MAYDLLSLAISQHGKGIAIVVPLSGFVRPALDGIAVEKLDAKVRACSTKNLCYGGSDVMKCLRWAFVVVAGLTFAPAWLLAAPVVGPTVATPAQVGVGVLTPVVVTAQIADPSVIATGVNLLRTDATGRTLAVVGVMHDDGVNGDAVASV